MQRSCPHTFISPNVTGQYSSYTPTWTIAFSRYKDPISAYAPSNVSVNEPEDLVIVENDAIAVNISNSKGSFGKMASISLKITNVNYPVLINNGDWCFIWINDNQQDANTIALELGKVRDAAGHKTNGRLNNHQSGFKFMGRVTSTSMSDSMSGGTRTVSCSIQAQAFLEMASSLYYLFPPDLALKSLEVQKTGSSIVSQVSSEANVLSLLGSIVDSNIATLASNVYKILLEPDAQKKTPDIVIGLLFLTCLGVSSPAEADKVTGKRGTVSKVILPTRHVFQILGIDPGKIWDIYQVYLGLQTYSQSNGSKWFENFAPAINDQAVGGLSDPKAKTNFFHLTTSRCKGYTPFISPEWNNKSVWETMSDYLNPVSNEMYTSLKLDHTGQIRPQLIVREVPFSTGNWKKITETNKMDIQVDQKQSETNPNIFSYDQVGAGTETGFLDNLPGAAGKIAGAAGTVATKIGGIKALSSQNSPAGAIADLRTYYGNLPRWIVDEALITDFTWHTDEAERINFVQITGTNGSLTFVGDKALNQDTKTASQLRLGNYVVDDLDIQRHGTRAFVMSTPFDMSPENSLTFTFAPIWAKMQADWKFNGHLKAKGQLTTIGCSLPVAEGDNLEVRGLLFHIEAVNHSASLGQNGTKQFRTTYSLSHGVIASSLSNVQNSPRYVSLDTIGIYATNTPGPGLTEVQKRLTGQAINPTDVRTKATSYIQGKI